MAEVSKNYPHEFSDEALKESINKYSRELNKTNLTAPLCQYSWYTSPVVN
jgi:hypothetical protein